MNVARAVAAASVLAILAAAGCGGGTTINAGAPQPEVQVFDQGSAEQYRGMIVKIEGEFDRIQNEHGVVKLDSGLKVYLPHIDLYLRGEPWGTYVKKRVRVSGLLRTDNSGIPGQNGPAIDSDTIYYFRVIDQ